ncbi:structural protein [Cellulophaga phage phi4:1]|uniref:Structural protein n=3 Tax=Lightbulbvirus Cba41 TaxID=1918524 RepID=A0A0S2MWF4_9CAUD|nr:pectate lyase [Cellulophaga phage phi4:1]AGO49464.1 structural protein [Cellulophaga phage phi4:1]ALO80060.1 structural protein [Cellulophaga phage phi4:1_13]ALO80257.1 structural protein [Cellulophaga phage phi4:1_18]
MAEPIIKKENIEDLPISKVINLQDTLDNFTGGGDVYNNIFRDSSDSGLTGTIDGTNTSFTVSNGSYNPGTLNVFVEGQLFVDGHGVIETTPGTGVFTFEIAPETGTSLYVTYQVGNTVTDIVDGSIIESKLSSDVISNFKNTPNGYVSPREYNSIMDGITDDRDTFESTLIAARAVGKRVIVDRDIFLDVSETSSSIILESGDWIEGINGANIIVNNLLTPAFLMVLTSNITFKNINIVYDQTYDATVSGSTEDSNNFISFLNNYLVSNRGITLTNSNFGWTGRSSLRYTFMIDACEDILFDNVTVKSKGETADKFMIGAFKLKWEWAKNSTITSNVGDTSICKNITFKDIILDGYIMGIQGVVDGFKVDNFKAYRYSDVQTASGTEIGGTAFWMAPPHLFYLNTDASPLYNTQNVEIRNTIDYGILVGSNDHRSETSGYCTSLKMINTVTNVYVDNYTSLRRDGLGEIQDMSNATYKNIYSESEIGIFDSSVGFNAFRFLGTIENVHFENVTLKDKSTYLEIYPLDLASGNNSSMTNFNVIIEGELNTDIYGCYGISGSNNKITNSFLKIGNHTSTQDFRGVIYHDNTALLSGANNHYEVIVQGWRDLGSTPSSIRPRVLLASALNPNNNYAKLVDISNNYVAEQINGVLTGTLIKSEIVTLGTGTSQALSMNIPTGFALSKVIAETITALTSGTNVTIGTGNITDKANLIANVYETTGKVDFNINENSHYSGSRTIYINSDTDFASSGVIKVTIELKRYSETSFNKSDNVIANVTDNSVTTSKIVDANVSLAKLSPSVQSTLNQAILSYETLEENEILVVKSDGTIEGVPNFTFTGALLQVGSTASGIYSQLGDNTFSFARNADSSIRQIGGADINFQTQNSSASNTTRLKIEGGSDNGFVELYNSTLKKNTLDTAPANSSATGTAGEVRFTSTGVYICIATNSWIDGSGSTF